MDRKIALVTGSTDGIGRQTALELAQKGFHVIVHGRNAKKAERTRDELKKESGSNAIDAVMADFASLNEVKAMAKDVKKRFPKLDVLINNAGILSQERHESKDGYELTFAVNHLAPFLLTRELLGHLNKGARIVNVSSQVHVGAGIDFDDLDLKSGYSGYGAYGTSKLANVLFTNALSRRLESKGITANSLHPGVIGTKLLREGFGGMGGGSVKAGAQTSLHLATSPDVEGVSGRYFSHSREASMSELARDEQLQERLWKVSEERVDRALGR